MSLTYEQQRARRDLHQRIARLRRRVEKRTRIVADEAVRMMSWKTYVRHYPVLAVAVSVAAGFVSAAAMMVRGRKADAPGDGSGATADGSCGGASGTALSPLTLLRLATTIWKWTRK